MWSMNTMRTVNGTLNSFMVYDIYKKVKASVDMKAWNTVVVNISMPVSNIINNSILQPLDVEIKDI